jgi:hypothetical protein
MKEPSVDQDSQTQPAPVPTTPVSPQAAPAWTPDPAPMPATAPVTKTEPPRKGPSARVLNVILAGALVLAVSGIAFAAGRMTAPAAAATGPGNFPGAGQGPNGYFGGRPNGQGGGFGGGAFAGAGGGGVTIEGTVDAISATTLTLKLASGQTIQIALDPTTTYHAQTDASSSEVVSGGKVQVQLDISRGAGAENGTVSGTTARDITVVP